jgi:hypothetical protein
MSETTDTKPLWQMDVRHRLGLEPWKTDVVSRLLFGALYTSEDEDDFVNSVQNHVDELTRAINALKGAK